MPFYLREWVCSKCHRPAPYELVSPINEVLGHYCKKDGARELARLNADPKLAAALVQAVDGRIPDPPSNPALIQRG